MTLIDFDKKELHDIYSSLQYTRLEIGFESKSEEELYKIMECINGDADSYGDTVCESILDKIANLDDLCECGGKTN